VKTLGELILAREQRAIKRKGTMPQDVVQRMLWTGSAKNRITDARGALEQNVWVARAIRTIAQKGASVPWQLVDMKGEASEPAAKKLLQCNPLETWGELIQRVLAWQSLSGFGVLYYEAPYLYSYEADQVEITSQSGWLALRYHQANGVTVPLQAEKVVICPGFKPFYTLTGVSDLLPAMDAANLEENALHLTNNIMTHGGILAGLLTTDQDLEDEDVNAVKAVFEARYGGIDNSGQVGVFGRGLKWTPLGVDPSTFAALDIAKLTRPQIGAALGVPGMFLNDTESVDYANSRTQERILYRETIQPKCDLLAARLTRFLLPIMGLGAYAFQFDWSQVDVLQEDKLTQAQVAQVQAQVDQIKLNSSVVTINELRIRDNLPPVPWGDRPMVSAMLVPIADTSASNSPPEPEPKPEPTPPDDAGKAWALMFGQPKKKQLSHESRKAYWMTFALKTVPQERKFGREVMGVFRKQGKRVVAALERHGPKGSKGGTQDWVDDALGDGTDYAQATRSVYTSFGMQAAEDFQAQWGLANKLDPRVFRAWIDKRQLQVSKYLDETTGNDVRDILARLSAEGQGIPDMITAIQGYFDGVGYRAERVARTEVIGTNNFATIEEYRENGGEAKEWLATQDMATRDAHMEADGQQVPIDEPFTVDGEQLDYPGDAAGSPGNIVNCRCTWLPVIGGAASSVPLPESEDHTPVNIPDDEPLVQPVPVSQPIPPEPPLPDRYVKGMENLKAAMKAKGYDLPQDVQDHVDRMAKVIGDKAPAVIVDNRSSYYAAGEVHIYVPSKLVNGDRVGEVVVHEMTHAVHDLAITRSVAADPTVYDKFTALEKTIIKARKAAGLVDGVPLADWATARGITIPADASGEALATVGDLWTSGSTASRTWGHSKSYFAKPVPGLGNRHVHELLAEYVAGRDDPLMTVWRGVPELTPVFDAVDDILEPYGGLH